MQPSLTRRLVHLPDVDMSVGVGVDPDPSRIERGDVLDQGVRLSSPDASGGIAGEEDVAEDDVVVEIVVRVVTLLS